METIRTVRHRIFGFLIVATFAANAASSAQLTFDISTNFLVSGGTVSGVGSMQFDTATGVASAVIDETSSTAAIPVVPILVFCLLFCLPAPLEGIQSESLYDLSGSNLQASLLVDFGGLGEASFDTTLIGTSFNVSGDYSGLDSSILTVPAGITTYTSSTLITGLGPGMATGHGVANFNGLTAQTTADYLFAGNPSAEISRGSNLAQKGNFFESAPGQVTISSVIESTPVPLPTTLPLLVGAVITLCARRFLSLGIPYWSKRLGRSCERGLGRGPHSALPSFPAIPVVGTISDA